MARSKRGGRITTSATPPQLFAQQRKNTTETKYYGLVRDEALSDLTAPDKALDEVLTDIQDAAEASTLGKFTPNDLQVLDAALLYDLKKEDFQILSNSSINAEDAQTGRLVPIINPRQRISDRIKQFESFAGRGAVYQGQGTALFKYYVPIEKDSNGDEIEPLYNHTNPPPFFTESITSSAENAPDFIPSTPLQIENTHRVGFIQNEQFVPVQDPEWWWNGEYNHEFRDRSEYRDETRTALIDPTYPIVRDGNLKFSDILPEGINSQFNWGLRFDTWFKKDFGSNQNFMRWVAQVNGHVRIDYFDRTEYDSNGAIQGSWKTALDTTNPSTFYTQLAKENPTSSLIGARLYYLQGGPETPLGADTGTLPTQRTPGNGGALDLNATFLGRENETRSRFNDDYVPVVIRFWYGRPNPAESNPVLREPQGPASLVLDMLDSSISEANLSLWNDYSAQIRVIWDDAAQAWEAEGIAEENFSNFADNFEILAHGEIGSNPSKPTTLPGYLFPQGGPIIATKQSPDGGVTRARFSIPGISPTAGQKIWVVAKNRPWNIIRSGNRVVEELWQRYLFHPNLLGRYKTAQDLLDGVGQNYVEPDPIYTAFEENQNYYKAKYVKLPSLGTYGPSRYDGMIRNSLTTSAGSRDYDYLHSKLLLVGRQRKDASIQPLAPGEVRNKGENYTFIEVVKNRAGRGGNVIINAYPTNNLSVLSTAVDNAQLGKFLHMGDNTKTFNNPSKQNISIINPTSLPASGFPDTARLRYIELGNGSSRITYGAWSGSAFSPDATGIIANLSMGTGGLRSHGSKSAFLSDFATTNGNKYSFYGLIGITRPSLEGQSITVGSENTISSEVLFPNSGSASNNDQYIGTEIVFGGDGESYYVISYDANAQVVTFDPPKVAGTYTDSQVWYNHFVLGSPLPSRVVDSSSENVSRGTVLSDNEFLQASITFNGAYQYTRADNGSGLSFSETLYTKQSSAPTPSSPFTVDTELPAPPADIVVPFGYDNTPSAGDPGLGGLCYPPYSIQNIDLQQIVANDTTLYASAIGNYDMWWGSKSDLLTLGEKSLTITNKLLFDLDNDDVDEVTKEKKLLQKIVDSSSKPTFGGSEYSHKLEIELNVQVPTPPEAANPFLFEDAKYYSNNKPVKDKYYLFIYNNDSDLEVLSPTNPNW
jgi:hypothetical protein